MFPSLASGATTCPSPSVTLCHPVGLPLLPADVRSAEPKLASVSLLVPSPCSYTRPHWSLPRPLTGPPAALLAPRPDRHSTQPQSESELRYICEACHPESVCRWRKRAYLLMAPTRPSTIPTGSPKSPPTTCLSLPPSQSTSLLLPANPKSFHLRAFAHAIPPFPKTCFLKLFYFLLRCHLLREQP